MKLENGLFAEVLVILQKLKLHSSIWSGLKTILQQMTLSDKKIKNLR